MGDDENYNAEEEETQDAKCLGAAGGGPLRDVNGRMWIVDGDWMLGVGEFDKFGIRNRRETSIEESAISGRTIRITLVAGAYRRVLVVTLPLDDITSARRKLACLV
jgi:hypothetical protein